MLRRGSSLVQFEGLSAAIFADGSGGQVERGGHPALRGCRSGFDLRQRQQGGGPLRAPIFRAVAKVLPNADVVDLAADKAKGITAGQAPNSAGAPGEIRTRAPASGGRCSIP